MEKQLFIGIDVSKARLDVALRPGGESFSVANHQRGIAALIKQLKKLSVGRIVLEASGGYEIGAASELAAAGCLSPWSIRARSATLCARLAGWRRPMRSMHASWRTSPN